MPRNRYMVVLVFVAFFVMSLLTNILGPIVPDIIQSFRLSLTAAGFLAFAFFVAYGVMSIPAGFMVERFSEKPVMVLSFIAATAGSLSFALFPGYRVAIVSLFVIGAGMAILQVVLNPLLRVAGGEEHFAYNSALAQLIFSSASIASPWIYSYLVNNLSHPSSSQSLLLQLFSRLTPPGLPWAAIYWLFALSSIIMVVVAGISRFPRVEHTADERAGSLDMYRALLRRPIVWLYVLSIFAYVGCEQGTADWISSFLYRYHGYDPHTTGAAAVSWFWGLLTAGCVVGMLLLKLYDSRRILIGASIGAMLCLSAALFAPSHISLWAFPAIGFFASVMWPILISLALNSVAEYHGSFSGILSTAIIGGAVVPLIIGRIGDFAGLRSGVAFLYLTYGYILSVGFWANPLIANATINTRAEHAG
jgi:MFS transporter, FHS family, L-fucose permease